MRHRLLAAAWPVARLAGLGLLLALARPAGAEEPPAEGRLDGDTHVEVLGRPAEVGKRIELPEGWYRVEEEGVEDRDVGSFTVATPGEVAGDRSSGPGPGSGPGSGSFTGPVRPPGPVAAPVEPAACHAERAAYLRELWRMSGIEVDDPEAVLRGLEAEGPGAADAYVFALSSDPVRPLAWSSELRGRARDLARCVRDRG
jgi:hypothetical protein